MSGSADECSFPSLAPVLCGAHVVLRPPSGRDAKDICALGRDPDVYRCFGEQVDEWRELSLKEASAFLADLRPSPDGLPWVIEVVGAFVGTARLHSLDREARTAAYAVGILSPRHLGRGYGTETTTLVLDYAFASLGLLSVTARVLDFNERAIRCYANCGFGMEQREPRAVELDGCWHDDLIMRAHRGPTSAHAETSPV
jgi:RimJ/RimL family protein N-acetyltransferase